MLDEKTAKQLAAPLDPARVTVGEKGPLSGVPYLEGEDVIRTANEIFGFGGWAFSLLAMPIVTETPTKAYDNKPSEMKKVVSAWGQVVVDGAVAPYSDIGTCDISGEGPSGFQMAMKGAVTDALKRCLRLWGDQFGLQLYDKSIDGHEAHRRWQEHLAAQGQVATGDPPPPPTEKKVPSNGILTALPEKGTDRMWWETFLAATRGRDISAEILLEAMGLPPNTKVSFALVRDYLAAQDISAETLLRRADEKRAVAGRA